MVVTPLYIVSILPKAIEKGKVFWKKFEVGRERTFFCFDHFKTLLTYIHLITSHFFFLTKELDDLKILSFFI